MRKPTICICENKDTVCVGPGRKPECWFSHDAAHMSEILAFAGHSLYEAFSGQCFCTGYPPHF